ncbi:MAG: MscS Mechanosensitive ion channel [Thermoleophilia bacterium]|nr:MscS Mechanosensitive ion channel [Thermoleophilia bacterium]
MDAIRDIWGDPPTAVTTAIAVVALLVGAIVVERLLRRLLRRAYWRRVERASAAQGIEELSRMKRQKTLVTLLESLVRYTVYGAALFVIVGVISGGTTNALFSASIVAVIVGFAFQRLLGDVIAGALLLFEGQFAVGDVVTVHQHNVTGVVEEFSLRTTSLRTHGGDRITIMNGGMISFTRWSYGQREFRLELLVRGAGGAAMVGAACAAEGESASALWVRAPWVVTTEPAGEELERVVVNVIVAPGHEELVTRLGEVLAARIGEDRLVGPVTAVAHYAPSFQAWRAGLLLRDPG